MSRGVESVGCDFHFMEGKTEDMLLIGARGLLVRNSEVLSLVN